MPKQERRRAKQSSHPERSEGPDSCGFKGPSGFALGMTAIIVRHLAPDDLDDVHLAEGVGAVAVDGAAVLGGKHGSRHARELVFGNIDQRA